MMGIKERGFDPLPRETSLEELVPPDHFYRRLEASLSTSPSYENWCVRFTRAEAGRR
jgi:hypothetical protein